MRGHVPCGYEWTDDHGEEHVCEQPEGHGDAHLCGPCQDHGRVVIAPNEEE